jgi:hypothetical protein
VGIVPMVLVLAVFLISGCTSQQNIQTNSQDLLLVKNTDLPPNWTFFGDGYKEFKPYMWSTEGFVDGVEISMEQRLRFVDIDVAKYNSDSTALANYNAFVKDKPSLFDVSEVNAQCLGYYEDVTGTEAGLVEMICVKKNIIFYVEANVYGADYTEIALQFAKIVSGNII